MIGFYAAGAMGSGGGGGGGALHDAIMTHGPFMYLRHAEASGSVAVNDGTGPNGEYFDVALGQAPLYSGGGTSLRMTSAGGRANFPGTAVPSLTAMTLGTIYRPAAIAAIRQIISRDVDVGGARVWQWRIDGETMRFIKNIGGLQIVDRAHGFTAGVPALAVVTVSATGVVRQFVNGVKLGADGSISAADYGGSDPTPIQVGNRGTIEGQENDRFSESFAIATDLSELDVMALAVAAGFA